MSIPAHAIVGLTGSGLTTQCLQWLGDLLKDGVPPDRVLVLVRHSVKAKEFQTRFYQSHGNILGELQVKGYTSFVQSQLSQFWAEVCTQRPDLPPTFQPVFLTKDLTQFLLSSAFDRCADHYQRFKSCTLPDYKILDQIVSDSYIAQGACIPRTEIGLRLASAWIDQQNGRHLSMLKGIPCCLRHLREAALAQGTIDFGFQLELFHGVLLTIDRFWQSWDYLIVDNVEESNEVFLHFYQMALAKQKHLFFSYRIGEGLNYTNAGRAIANFIYKNSKYSYSGLYPGMGELGIAIGEELGTKLKFPVKPKTRKNYTDRVKLLITPTYLKAIETTIATVTNLLENQTKPDRIAILMPKFDLAVMQVIQHSSIGSYCSFLNPSMSFLRYPIIQAMITLAQLTQRHLFAPSLAEISVLVSIFVGTDRIRSMLLAQTFDRENFCFHPVVSPRVDPASLDKFTLFTHRLNFYQQNALRLDLFWGNIIREFSPNFQLNPTDREVLNSLMTTVRRFFQTFPNFTSCQFIQMLLSGQTPTILRQWDYDQKIIVATPLQFLKTDRVTDYQFWFNISGAEWRKPICKELLNHEVLTPSWQGIYTTAIDQELRTEQLARTLLNLCCRNQKSIYLINSQTTIQGQTNYADLDSKICQATLPT